MRSDPMLPQAAQQSECIVHGMVPPLLIGTAVVCLPPKVEAVEVEVILKVKLVPVRYRDRYRCRYRSVVCELHVMILKIGHRATDFNFLYLFQLILVTSEAKTGTQVFVSS